MRQPHIFAVGGISILRQIEAQRVTIYRRQQRDGATHAVVRSTPWSPHSSMLSSSYCVCLLFPIWQKEPVQTDEQFRVRGSDALPILELLFFSRAKRPPLDRTLSTVKGPWRESTFQWIVLKFYLPPFQSDSYCDHLLTFTMLVVWLHGTAPVSLFQFLNVKLIYTDALVFGITMETGPVPVVATAKVRLALHDEIVVIMTVRVD